MNKVKNKVIMGQLKYKGYAGSVEYNEEDNCLFGKVLGLKKDCITYEGETISELKSDFELSLVDYVIFHSLLYLCCTNLKIRTVCLPKRRICSAEPC